MKGKFIVYQMLLRVFANAHSVNRPGGNLQENGSGKFKDITVSVLEELRRLNVTHVWYTGVIRHATAGGTGVKGGAGSPFAITDYYDVNPYLASREAGRMKEFEAMIARTVDSGLTPIIDFVPNHVSPDYHSAVEDFGEQNYRRLRGAELLPRKDSRLGLERHGQAGLQLP